MLLLRAEGTAGRAAISHLQRREEAIRFRRSTTLTSVPLKAYVPCVDDTDTLCQQCLLLAVVVDRFGYSLADISITLVYCYFLWSIEIVADQIDQRWIE